MQHDGLDLGKAKTVEEAAELVARGEAFWLLRGPEPLLCLVDRGYVPKEGETAFSLPRG